MVVVVPTKNSKPIATDDAAPDVSPDVLGDISSMSVSEHIYLKFAF